jgi:hypothetical protein
VALAAEHVPTTTTTIENGPSPTPTTTRPDQGEAATEGGSFKVRTSLESSSGSPSFEDHRGHQ